MNPALWYALCAGGAAFALHKRKWGWFFFACAGMAWIVLILILNTYAMHGISQ